MKSKKIITALLAAGMLLSFAACSTGDAPSSEPESSKSSNSEESKEPESKKDDAKGGEDSSSEANNKKKQVFGKVGNAAGNEITLNLATPPLVEGLEITTGSGEGGDAGEEPKGGGDMIKSEGLTVAGGNEEGGGAQRPQMVLEYTGEEEDIVIPAGTPITKNGADETMDAIKKGSVLMIYYDESGNIESIEIWE